MASDDLNRLTNSRGQIFEFRRARALTVVFTMLVTLLVAAPAQAQTNDSRASAAVVTDPLPYTDSVDTTDATGEPGDPGCTTTAGDLESPTVWYSYTPSADGSIVANTFGSDYDTALGAYIDIGDGVLGQLACNDDTITGLQSQVLIDVFAGRTVLFMVTACCGGTSGGQLEFTVDLPPEPLTANITIDSQHFVIPSEGTATVSGTAECSRPGRVQVSANLSQTRGGAAVAGLGFESVDCGESTAWSVEIEPASEGRFSGGRAELTVGGIAFDEGGFVSLDDQTAEIRLRGSAPSDPGPQVRVDITSDLVYGEADGQELLLDLYEPRGPRRDRPLVIYAHGGSFVSGSKTSGVAVSYATDLAAEGIVTASINYRLNGIGPGIFDAQHDMQAAVRWFRTNADQLGIDPDRIYVMGYSAGAIAGMYTVFNSEDPGESGNAGVSSEVAGGISLAGFAAPGLIDAGEPPVLLFHGTTDNTVPVVLGEATCSATISRGNDCELVLYEGYGHWLENFHDEIVARTVGFVAATTG